MSYSPILLLHVSGGGLGLLSGAVALSFRKGSRPHGIAGNVFFIAMLTASAAGAYLAFRNTEMDNVFGGVLTFYLVATAWVTARHRDGETGIFDWIGLLVALAVSAVAVIYGIEAAYSQTGTKDGLPASGYVFPGSLALLSATGDARMLLRGGLCGAQRIARHLWRMCFALFVASASIFLARPQLFPALLTKTHVLFILGILPLILMVFWLVRVRFTNAYKGRMRDEVKFTVSCTLGLVLVLFLISSSFAQEPRQPSSAQPTIRVQSSLVLVDVISRDPRTGQPVRDFQKEDFRMLDDGQEVSIASFDSGLRNDARPIILWLVVICNEGGKVGGSKEFVGKEAYFRRALDHLDKNDTVGVAHWCDNGETRLDLLPTEDRDTAIRVLAETIRPISFHVGGDSDEVGEVTYRKMMRLIIQDAHRRNPQPLPAIVLLDGDHTGQPRSELDKVVDDLLQTSGIVFGIKDEQAPFCCFLMIGEQGQISHYVAKQTGGEYFTAPASGYAAALEMILAQLHARYELGFVPPTIDGKRHKLNVELMKEARRRHKGIQLRFRREYIPVREEPEWAH